MGVARRQCSRMDSKAFAGGGRSRRTPPSGLTPLILRTWGAAMLRPNTCRAAVPSTSLAAFKVTPADSRRVALLSLISCRVAKIGRCWGQWRKNVFRRIG